MPPPSRTTRLNKVHQVLKKYYQMVAPDPDRSVLEQLVFACCLENAHYDRAEEAYAALEHNFFDWNEIRVTTIRELSEVLARLPNPAAAGNRVKRVLQSIFESSYSYDLEDLRKKNLGPALEDLRKIDGTTRFSVAYVIQAALGGHAIPVDGGALGALYVVDLVTDEDVKSGVVPGLDRAIAKNKGLEFGSQLHQLGADFVANPCALELHEILLEINPDARPRLPKRRARKRRETPSTPGEPKPSPKKAKKPARTKTTEEAAGRKRKQAAGKAKSPEAKPAERPNKTPDQQTQAPQDEAAGPQAQQPPAAKKRPPQAKSKSTPKKKPTARKAKAEADAGPKKSDSARLSRRKPR